MIPSIDKTYDFSKIKMSHKYLQKELIICTTVKADALKMWIFSMIYKDELIFSESS